MRSDSDNEKAAARLRLAFDLFEAGVKIMRQNLKRRFPDADPEEIRDRLNQWLQERPGAEHGDSSGRPIPWPRTTS